MNQITVQAAGHTWYRVERGCWHQDDSGRCLSWQGLLDEHAEHVWLQARQYHKFRDRLRRWASWQVGMSR